MFLTIFQILKKVFQKKLHDLFHLTLNDFPLKYIFGNNLGHWTNRKMLANDDFIFNLKDISIPVIRFPGGNASNDYFWNAGSLDQCPEGTPSVIYKQGFKKTTPPKLGTNGSFRTRPEDYYELLLRTKSTGSICVNYSMALYSEIEDEQKRVEVAADYAAAWVKEVNIKRGLNIKFWEIGNENWGKWQAGYEVKNGGIIDPQKYGQHCKLFIEKMKAVDPSIKVGVVGYQKPKTRDPVQKRWNELVLPEIIDVADFYILHDYYAKHGAVLTPEEMLNAIDTTYSHIRVVNEAIENNIFDTSSYERIKNSGNIEDFNRITSIEFAFWGIITEWGYGDIYDLPHDEFTISTPNEVKEQLPLFHKLFENTIKTIFTPPDKEYLREMFR